MNEKRDKAETLIYKVFDALDKSGSNTEYYKKLFSKMDDKQFEKFCRRDFPFKLHIKPFEIEPTISDIVDGLNILEVPLMEKVYLPYLNTKDNKPVKTQEAFVVYMPIKKMKQFLTKKNAMSTNIDQRDMKTGLLVSFDKNGKTSDREMESLAVMGLNNTMKEMARYRADSMKAKTDMYSNINNTGFVSQKDVPVEKDDSLSKNMLNIYLLSCGINTNLLNEDYMLPYTIKNKDRSVKRI